MANSLVKALTATPVTTVSRTVPKRRTVNFTENGAVTNSTTGSNLLDFFGQAGAMRERSERDVFALFGSALAEDKALALKAAFYTRDVRGGLGERETFRRVLKFLAVKEPKILEKNLENIPFYGRWDDLWVLLGTSLESKIVEMVRKQLITDLESEHPSLLGKWMPSINASNAVTKANGRKLAKALGVSEKQYRAVLTSLRKQIKVVETLMTAKEWDEINYEHVPSKAAMNYRNAFKKNDAERYQEYLNSVAKGEATIKAGALFPYELTRKVIKGDVSGADALNAQWEALPDYLANNPHNGLVMADVSSSMTSNDNLPMAVSISLGLYMAERVEGPFKNHILTFETSPKFHIVKGRNFIEKTQNIRRAAWGGSTNVQAAFDLILDTAVKNKVKASDMPDVLYIVSDMEFNVANGNGGYYSRRNNVETNFEAIKRKYANAGYEMPKLVFWNVNARNDQSPITIDDNGTVLVSGASPVIFKNVLEGKNLDAVGLMLNVLNAERYDRVTI
jgi:hypothetical protein